jgi:alcohol dehydrogenase, propanol-preferring
VRAYRLLGVQHAALVDVHKPRPRADEVLLQVTAAGVCHTDVTLLRSPTPGAASLPVTLGHEIVGRIEQLGADVRDWSAGSAAAVYELIGCGRCAVCRRGQDNLCSEASPAVPGITRDGGMADYVVVPARNLVALGPLDPVAAAPLTDAGMTALHAVGRGRPFLGGDARAVVIGIGGLGHLAVQFVRATTEARVAAVDADRSRLDLAAGLGADIGVLAGATAAEQLIEANARRKVDVVFDFVGSQDSVDLAAQITARGGAIIITGGGGGRLCVTAAMGTAGVPEREVTIVHTFGGTRGDLVEALELAGTGRVRSRTQTYRLEAAAEAMGDLEGGRVVGRAVLVP